MGDLDVGRRGVAGERWVPSTAVRASRNEDPNEDPEPLLPICSTAAGVMNRAGLFARLRRGDSSSTSSPSSSPSMITALVEDLCFFCVSPSGCRVSESAKPR